MSVQLHKKNTVDIQTDTGSPAVNKTLKKRQKYHFMGENGWINDPNGLIFYNNKYHLFYQHNPSSDEWAKMHWGHAISDDFVHWEYLPVALTPDEPYDLDEKGGCFSGSAVEKDGILYLFYTGSYHIGETRMQCQCLAYSTDGIHFHKHKENPIIAHPPYGFDESNFRDPKVWFHEDRYYLICGCKKENLAQLLIYYSYDLFDWKFMNVMAESRGELGEMWECPDYYCLDGKEILTFSPMGLYDRKAVYLIGNMDYKTGKFHYNSIGEIDWGFDFYAPQSLSGTGGRRIMTAWANEWKWMHWFNGWGPSGEEGWTGFLNLPREVKVGKDNQLQFVPIKELQKLRKTARNIKQLEVKKELVQIPVSCPCFEMKFSVKLDETSASGFQLLLHCFGNRKTVIAVSLSKGEIWIDRNQADAYSSGISRSALQLINEDYLNFHIFVDNCSVELFTDDYRTVHSCNIYCLEEITENYFSVQDGALLIEDIEIWEL